MVFGALQDIRFGWSGIEDAPKTIEKIQVKLCQCQNYVRM